NGTVSLGGATLSVTFINGFSEGGTFTLIDNDGTDPVTGQFAQGTAFSANGVDYRINYAGGDGNDVVLTFGVVLADDSATTNEDTGVTFPVLGNALFAGSPAITATTNGAHGTVTITDVGAPGSSPDDVVRYTPAGDFNGIDTFTYTVTSGSISATATVSVTVNAVADIAGDNATTNEDTAV